MFNPLDHPLFLVTPDRLRGGPRTGYVPLAMGLVGMLRPRALAALGIGEGDVYLALCQAVATLALPALCRGVDPLIGAELRAYHDARHAAFSQLTSAAPFDDAAVATLDLLVVDPARVDAAEALAAWKPRLSERAVVLIHDVLVDGVAARLWTELSARRPSFRFDHDRGLGLVAVGAEPPEPVAALAALGAGEASTLRAWCAQLGRSLVGTSRRELAALEYAGYLDALLAEVLGSVSFRLGMAATAPLRRAVDELDDARAWVRRNRAVRRPRDRHAPDGRGTAAVRLKELTPGSRPPRVCLFSHYDRDGIVDDYVLHYLDALRRCDLEVVFVSTAPTLRPDSAEQVAQRCAAVLLRENVGLDFGSWRAALDEWPWLVDGELLVLANDSVYGPLTDLRPLFDAMNAQPCDFWGMTEARQPSTHLQSYFLVLKRRALQSSAFRAFFRGVELLSEKQRVIDEYELTLASRLAADGLRWTAVAPHVELGGRGVNPMHQLWRSTLDAGVPFVKIELLRDNPLHANLAGWESFLRERFGYDTQRIARHLRRIKPGAAALH